jgi:hypothetical protein
MPILPYEPPGPDGLTRHQAAITVAEVAEKGWALCFGCRACGRPGRRIGPAEMLELFPPQTTMRAALARLRCSAEGCNGQARGSFVADVAYVIAQNVARFEAEAR